MQRSLTLMFLLLMLFVRLAHAADGDLDLSFGVNGVATVAVVNGDSVDQTAAMTRDIDLGGDEWIYLCGTSEGAPTVLKISAETGVLDPTYGNAGVANFYDSEELANLGFSYTIFDCAVDTTSHALYLVGRGKTIVNVTNHDFFVMKLTEDGALDTSFGDGAGAVLHDAGGAAQDSAQALWLGDGVVNVVGYGQIANLSDRDFVLMQLSKSSGELNTSFDASDDLVNGILLFDAGADDDDSAFDLVGDADGNLYLAGFGQGAASSSDDFVLMKVLASGGLDPDFGTAGIVVQDGGGTFQQDRALGLLRKADGTLVVAGSGYDLGSISIDVLLMKFSNVGALDTSFGGGDGIVAFDHSLGDTDVASRLTQDSDGNLFIVGYEASPDTLSNDILVIKTDADGALIAGFNGTGIANFDLEDAANDDDDADILLDSNGNVFIAAYGTETADVYTDYYVVKSDPIDAEFVPEFDEDGVFVSDGFGSSGDFNESGGVFAFDGSTFYLASTLNTQPDNSSDVVLAVFDANGQQEPSLGGGAGYVTFANAEFSYDVPSSLSVNTLGELYFAGLHSDGDENPLLIKTGLDYAYDLDFAGGDGFYIEDFGGATTDLLRKVIATSDGGALAVGYGHSDTSISQDMVLLKFDSAGDLDTSFGAGTGIVVLDSGDDLNDDLYDVVETADGKWLVAGTVSDASDNILVAQFLANGTLDTAFGDAGYFISDLSLSTDKQIYALALQSDGRVILVGNHDTATATQIDGILVRLTADGVLDTSFAGGDGYYLYDADLNYDETIIDVAINADDVIYGLLANSIEVGILRLTADGVPDLTFSGDGLATYTNLRINAESLEFELAECGAAYALFSGYENADNNNDLNIVKFNVDSAAYAVCYPEVGDDDDDDDDVVVGDDDDDPVIVVGDDDTTTGDDDTATGDDDDDFLDDTTETTAAGGCQLLVTTTPGSMVCFWPLLVITLAALHLRKGKQV